MEGGYSSILPGLVAMGLGMGLSMTPSTEAITGSLPRDEQGVASALNDITREFGTALGVALLGALLSAGYRGSINGKLSGVPQEAADVAREGVANAVDVSGSSGSHAAQIVQAARESFVDGWQQSMWAGVALMGVLLAYIALRGPKNTTPAAASDEAAEPEIVAAR